MSLIDSAGLLFGQLFAPLYHAAALRRGAASTYNADGDIVRGFTVEPCRAMVDRVTESMIAAEGYTATDRAVYVLGLGVDTDDEITMREGPYAGKTYRVAPPVDRDPAAAYSLFRGTAVGGGS